MWPHHTIFHRWHCRVHIASFKLQRPKYHSSSLNNNARYCPAPSHPIYCLILRRQRSSQLYWSPNFDDLCSKLNLYYILAAGTKEPCIVYNSVFHSSDLIISTNHGEEGRSDGVKLSPQTETHSPIRPDHAISWHGEAGRLPDWAWLELSLVSPLHWLTVRPQSTSLSEKQNMQPPPGGFRSVRK